MVKLTARRKQILVAIGWREHHFRKCTVADLLGDIGISHMSLFDHLEPLKTLNLVEFKGKARNLSSNDIISLTSKGKETFKNILNECGASVSEPILEVLEKVVRRYIIPSKRKKQKTLSGKFITIHSESHITGKISKIMDELFKNDKTEPVITSLTMYADIDQLLYELKEQKNPLFTKISRGWLNLEIRMGRLASLAIPTALRGTLQYQLLYKILRANWAWPEIVSSNSLRRYKIEANSLGLINIKGNIVESTRPSTTDILKWLAERTYTIFENSFSPNPKLSLLLYRETYKIPAENEIFEPESTSYLTWLLTTKEILRCDYHEYISKTYNILKQIGAIREFEDRVIPYGYLRIIESTEELKEQFNTLLKLSNEGSVLSDILLAIQSKPGITINEIVKLFKNSSEKSIRQCLDELQRKGFIIATMLPGKTVSYYTFLQVPYLQKIKDSKKSVKEVNTTIRYYLTFVLSLTKDLFKTSEELEWLYNVINNLYKNNYIDGEMLIYEYNSKFYAKFIKFITHLEPLIIMNDEDNRLIFEISTTSKNSTIAKCILELIAYEILTGSQALGEYSTVLSKIFNESVLHEELYELENILYRRKNIYKTKK